MRKILEPVFWFTVGALLLWFTAGRGDTVRAIIFAFIMGFWFSELLAGLRRRFA